jgi:hypothetical protein
MLMMTGCGDVVIKVSKKPKNVDLSAVENFSALNLQNSQDFLKHLDNLKVVAADLLIKELASRDYRSEVRNAIRGYRKFLIERASGSVKVDDSFYASADQCRASGLSFNMDEANDFLGIILKTAVLAKISEVSAPKLNPGISKELAAIGQIVLMELGLKIEGNVDVADVDGVTTTTGSFTLALADLQDEQIDQATKDADKVEVLTMSFTRALGANYVGTFAAAIDIAHAKADASVETLEAKIDVERKAQDDKFVHSLLFNLGVKGATPNYSRKLTFEQVDGEKQKLKVTDTLSPGLAGEKSVVTLLDTKALTQCKLDANTGGDGGTDKGDEGGFIPGTDGTTDGTGTDGSVDGSTPPSDGTDGSVPPSDGGSGSDDGKGTDDDDEPTKGGDDGKGGPNTPGQNPHQSPNQSPGQHI